MLGVEKLMKVIINAMSSLQQKTLISIQIVIYIYSLNSSLVCSIFFKRLSKFPLTMSRKITVFMVTHNAFEKVDD